MTDGAGRELERKADALEMYADYKLFYYMICDRANKIIEETGKVEGAHYAAMRIILSELGKRAGVATDDRPSSKRITS